MGGHLVGGGGGGAAAGGAAASVPPAGAGAGEFRAIHLPGELLAISKLGVVADLGVGSGELTLLLAQASTRLYAVDHQQSALQALAGRAPNLHLHLQDFQELQLLEILELLYLDPYRHRHYLINHNKQTQNLIF